MASAQTFRPRILLFSSPPPSKVSSHDIRLFSEWAVVSRDMQKSRANLFKRVKVSMSLISIVSVHLVPMRYAGWRRQNSPPDLSCHASKPTTQARHDDICIHQPGITFLFLKLRSYKVNTICTPAELHILFLMTITELLLATPRTWIYCISKFCCGRFLETNRKLLSS